MGRNAACIEAAPGTFRTRDFLFASASCRAGYAVTLEITLLEVRITFVG
jgi:hypothetical protein